MVEPRNWPWRQALMVIFVGTSIQGLRSSSQVGTTAGRSKRVRSTIQKRFTDDPQSLDLLLRKWNIPCSPTVQQSLRSNPELAQAFQTQDPLQFFQQIGRIRTDRFVLMMERHPILLAKAISSKQLCSIQSILTLSLGLSEQQWTRLTRKEQVSSWSRINVRRILRLFLHATSMDTKQLLKTILARPNLFTYKMQRLKEPIDYFYEIGLSKQNISRMIATWPVILTLNVDTNLRPTVQFLQSLGSELWDGWKQMLIRYPQLLTHSVDNVLRPKLDFIGTTLLKHNVHHSAVRIVSYFPPIFWLSPELLQLKVDYLTQKLDLTPEELRTVILTFPQVLGLSVDHNLEPTINFFWTCLTKDQLKEFFLYQPSLFAYSLEKRIRPRIEQLKENGIEFAYSPRYLMSLQEDKFQQWLSMHKESWSLSEIDE